jgi:hypothetical protein
LSFSGDTYSISASGDRVAIAVFNDLADSFVLVSEDNGSTWSKTLLIDFPVDLYVQDSEIIDLDYDGVADTLFSSDGSGTVFFDQAGGLHCSFGNMRYMDADLNDDVFSFFPGTSGLMYWNESMAPASPILIADTADVDGDGEFTFGTDLANYGVSLTGYPNMAADANGDLYVSYSAVIDGVIDPAGEFNYRHVFVVKSVDGGATWSEPIDVTPLDEEDEIPEIECLFATLVPTVINNKLIMAYQRDYQPGFVVPETPQDFDQSDNVIVLLEIDIDFLVTDLDDNEIESPFAVYPNPVTEGILTVEVDLSSDYQYQVIDMLGKEVMAGRLANFVEQIDVNALTPGVYVMRFNDGDSVFSHQVTIK